MTHTNGYMILSYIIIEKSNLYPLSKSIRHGDWLYMVPPLQLASVVLRWSAAYNALLERWRQPWVEAGFDPAVDQSQANVRQL